MHNRVSILQAFSFERAIFVCIAFKKQSNIHWKLIVSSALATMIDKLQKCTIHCRDTVASAESHQFVSLLWRHAPEAEL
jgi:hypothetical protein